MSDTWDVNQIVDDATFGLGLHCEAQRRRFVACVNFCRGTLTEAIELMTKSGFDTLTHICNDNQSIRQQLTAAKEEVERLKNYSVKGAAIMREEIDTLKTKLADAEKAVEWINKYSYIVRYNAIDREALESLDQLRKQLSKV